MEEVERGPEGRRLGSTRRRGGASEPMETRSGGKDSSEWPAREESGCPSWRPKNRDERPDKNRQTGNGLKMVFTIFSEKGEEEEIGSVPVSFFLFIDFVDWRRTD